VNLTEKGGLVYHFFVAKSHSTPPQNNRILNSLTISCSAGSDQTAMPPLIGETEKLHLRKELTDRILRL